MYFSTSQKYHLIFLPPSRLFAYLDFRVLKTKLKNQRYFQLPPSQPCKIGLGRFREPINQY